jgi:hypothetical protein
MYASGNEILSGDAMSFKPQAGSLAGRWTYRSLLNEPDLSVPFNDLEFGRAVLDIVAMPDGSLKGSIGGQDWSLQLEGWISHGNPGTVRFQGRGEVGGEQWVYDYLAYFCPPWPAGVDQRPAIAGTVIRTMPHSQGRAPAGVVCSFYAVMQDPAA